MTESNTVRNAIDEISRDLKKIVELLTPKEHNFTVTPGLNEKLEAFVEARSELNYLGIADAYVSVLPRDEKPTEFELASVNLPEDSPFELSYNPKPIKLTESDLHPWAEVFRPGHKPRVSVVWRRGKSVAKFIKKIEALGLTDDVRADVFKGFAEAIDDESISYHERIFYDSDFK